RLYPSSSFALTDPGTPAIYSLSLHDALPIWILLPGVDPGDELALAARLERLERNGIAAAPAAPAVSPPAAGTPAAAPPPTPAARSEEHTSELQSRENLVCRLLLEKKKRRGLR